MASFVRLRAVVGQSLAVGGEQATQVIGALTVVGHRGRRAVGLFKAPPEGSTQLRKLRMPTKPKNPTASTLSQAEDAMLDGAADTISMMPSAPKQDHGKTMRPSRTHKLPAKVQV